MKKTIYFLIIAAISVQAVAQSPSVAPAQKKPVLLDGGTIHTGTGTVIENGAVAFTDGKITFVG